MKTFVGYQTLKKLVGTWRAFHFLGVARGRWFFGFVKFEHISDPARPHFLGRFGR
jgi:hypothetical protein